MNQAKWLTDFKYDVEATPLLWSFDDSEQESVGSNSPLCCRSLSSPILTQWMDLDTTQEATIYSETLPTRNTRCTTSCQNIKRQRPRTAYRRARKNELNLETKPQTGVERYISSVKPQSETFDQTAMNSPVNTIKVPTYIELQQRENEKRRLLSVVKPFPSYLAITSPEKDDFGIITAEEIQNPSESSKLCNNNDVPRESTKANCYNDEYNLGDACSQHSAMNGLDNVEYLAGGIWYSDEEEEKAILKEAENMCAYENPAFEPDPFIESAHIHRKLRSFSDGRLAQGKANSHKRYRKAREMPDSDSAISLDERSLDEFRKLSPVPNMHDKHTSDYEEVDGISYLDRIHSGERYSKQSQRIADVIYFDDVLSLLEKCQPTSEISNDDRTSSDSEFEVLSQISAKTKISSSDITPAASDISDDDSELVWDAYVPPLTLRWSDVIIKQIFDTVERDNEEYVSRIRQMTRKRDMRPLNILQRLCWYDDETGTLQSLIGVFEYNL